MVTTHPDHLGNQLLKSLPDEDSKLLSPHLVLVDLAQGKVLFEPGQEVDAAYFPLCGMLSLLVVMRDGKAIETATVGREGVVGGMAGLGWHVSRVRAIAQLPMFASRVSAVRLRKVIKNSAPIANLCIHYNNILLEQTGVTAACNTLHPIEARLCRWLLQTRDRAESDTIPLTQEHLSERLGVRRTSVAGVESKFESRGAIRRSRGSIKLLDIEILKAFSCECYETLRKQIS
jgi:CRP-like cAMP-binding protein